MLSKKENSDPPSKKRKLSLSRKGKGRFSSVSEDHLTVMLKPQVPKNTEKASKWARVTFKKIGLKTTIAETQTILALVKF